MMFHAPCVAEYIYILVGDNFSFGFGKTLQIANSYKSVAIEYECVKQNKCNTYL